MSSLHSIPSLTRNHLRVVHDQQRPRRRGLIPRVLRSLTHALIRRQERAFEAQLDYLRDIADSSTSAVAKLALIGPLGTHRRHLPLTAWHVARVAATFAEDCGTCAQIALTLARRDHVPAATLRAVIARDASALPPPLRNIVDYAHAVTARQDDAELRERLRQHYGPDGLIELGLVIAVSRFIPGLKRALGHAQSCTLLRFDPRAA